MSCCEQELCRYWNGSAGCVCAVLDLQPVDAEGFPFEDEER